MDTDDSLPNNDNKNDDNNDTNNIALVIRGNIVFATHNPFDKTTTTNIEIDDDKRWIGPGLLLCLDHVVTVNDQGIITALEPAHQKELVDWDELLMPSAAHAVQTLDCRHEFLIPGLIDLHIHAPQFAYTGTATDRPLMGADGWLETYTFPAEAGLAHDAEKCRTVYEGVVDTTLVRLIGGGGGALLCIGAIPQKRVFFNLIDSLNRLSYFPVLMKGHGNNDSRLFCDAGRRALPNIGGYRTGKGTTRLHWKGLYGSVLTIQILPNNRTKYCRE